MPTLLWPSWRWITMSGTRRERAAADGARSGVVRRRSRPCGAGPRALPPPTMAVRALGADDAESGPIGTSRRTWFGFARSLVDGHGPSPRALVAASADFGK